MHLGYTKVNVGKKISFYRVSYFILNRRMAFMNGTKIVVTHF